MSEASARAALQRVEEIWPTMRPNKIRIVGPAAGSGSTRLRQPRCAEPPAQLLRPAREMPSTQRKRALPCVTTGRRIRRRSPEEKPQEEPQPAPGRTRRQSDDDRERASGQVFRRPHFIGGRSRPGKAAEEGKSPAPIIIIPGPNGLTITSEDLEALDEFEHLLATASDGRAMARWRSFTSSTPRPRTWQMSSTSFSPAGRPTKFFRRVRLRGRKALVTGPIKITPEPRLNALLVLANRADQDTIEQLLKILDLKESPEDIAVAPKPRMIPVEHARARDIADVLRQVYADRLVLSAQGQQQQGRGGFLPMLDAGNGRRLRRPRRRPGRWRRRRRLRWHGSGQNQRDTANRISIGVDTRTNTLVVAATDPLFEEVKQLVQQLDVAAASENETVRVVTLHRTSATAVEKALEAFAGDAVQTNNPTTSAPATINNTNCFSAAVGASEVSAACPADLADNRRWAAWRAFRRQFAPSKAVTAAAASAVAGGGRRWVGAAAAVVPGNSPNHAR